MTSPAPAHPDLYLVDGSGFIFRAFHALPPMTRGDGVPVNAVYGFSNMIYKLLTDFAAAQVAVIFDAKEETFRNKIYPDYKANRDAPPEELVPQFALIRESVHAFCLPCLELEGFEADDLIATYAKQAKARGQKVVIVSSDKDLMQLVGDGVTMWDPIKARSIAEPEVFEKFGVTPDKVVDVQALAGDSVDNVPGVPGIGIKTAAQLINEYGDLETLLARAGEIKQPKRRESLIEHAEKARVSKLLVKLDEAVPVTTPIDELRPREPDSSKLTAYLAKMEFKTLLNRVTTRLREEGQVVEHPDLPVETAAAAARALDPTPEAPVEARYELVQDLPALQRWIARAQRVGVVAFDTETDSLTPCVCGIVGVSLAVAPGEACYIPLCHVNPDAGGLDLDQAAKPQQISLDEFKTAIGPLLTDPSVLKIAHNGKFDLQVLQCLGLDVTPIDDTMLMSYALDGGSHGHGMDELASIHLGLKTTTFAEVCGSGKAQITFDRVPLDRALAYAAEDADVTLRLWQLFKQRLLADHMTTLYETIDRPLLRVVAGMESAGILIDRNALAKMGQKFGERMVQLEAEVQKLAGRPFNLGSPKQLGEVLFDELKLEGGRKLKSGAWTTDASVLDEIEDSHPIIPAIQSWRQLAKLKATYTDALQEEIQQKTGRVHTSYALAATSTGRLSSTEPNLQNIPIRTEEGRQIRTAFIAGPGNVLLSVDYSQIELRIVADIANIQALRDAFTNGDDIHALTASQVFGVPMADMTKDIRARAKAINFGIIYGISAFGLARQLGIPQSEASAYIKAYLERFSELRDYMEETKSFARKHGYVLTLLGRKCHVAGINEKNPARRSFAERQAINGRIQGTAADIMRRAMRNVSRALQRAGSPAQMLLQVHDELVFEVPETHAEATAAIVRTEMERAATLGVPLVAEAGWGKSWADAH
ncbi:DNA polymerase I [Roseiterribacter gracilis]|uniref:DNA polymerase I n=1 Tax=Roseiterribacter gracilis TaxID=2812848 RepID=A0A8S8XKY2_9PROT|nr:DNA polymerase I [Rhodospirillales bacterium TMPK1]